MNTRYLTYLNPTTQVVGFLLLTFGWNAVVGQTPFVLDDYFSAEQALASSSEAEWLDWMDGIQATQDSAWIRFNEALDNSRNNNYRLAEANFAAVQRLSEDINIRALSSFWQGLMLDFRAQHGVSLQAFNALQSAPYLKADSMVTMRAHIGIGNVLRFKGMTTNALLEYSKADAFYRQHGGLYMKAWVRELLSNLHIELGNFQLAETYSDETLALLEDSPYKRRYLKAINNRLSLLNLQNREQEAGALREQVRALSDAIGDSLIIYDLIFRADFNKELGNPAITDSLHQFMDAWMDYATRAEHKDKRSFIQELSAYHAYLIGDLSQAADFYLKAARLNADSEDWLASVKNADFAAYCAHEAALKEEELEALALASTANSELRKNDQATIPALFDFTQRAAANEQSLREEQLTNARNRNRFLVTSLMALVLIAAAVIGLVVQRNRKKAARLALVQQEQAAEEAVNALVQQHRYEKVLSYVDGEEQERDRIAKELHDGIGGTLAGLALQLEAASDAAKISDITRKLRNTHQELRMVSRNLAMPAFEENTLVELSSQLLKNVEVSTGLKVGFNYFPKSPMRLDAQLETNLYRVLQELTTNVMRHSEATTLQVSMTLHPDEFNLMVEDNGKGFDTSARTQGLGMRSMGERVSAFGGTIHFDTAPGKGTIATVVIPNPKRR